MFQGKQVVTVLVTLAVAFGLALVLNWGVLGFFGQESVDRAEHSLVGILLLLGYGGCGQPMVGRRFSAALVPCYLGTVFPPGYQAVGHRLPQQLFLWPGPGRSVATWAQAWISGCWVLAAIVTPSSTAACRFFVLVLLVRRQPR